MKKKIALFLAFILVLVLAGCGESSMSADAGAPDRSYMEEAYEMPMMEASASTANSGSAAQALPQNRKWVITMDISTETEALDAALEAVSSQIAQLGGYIEDQHISNGSAYSSRRYRSAYMTVRIPADQVESFVKAVGECSNVVSSSRNVKDITLSYTDTESRLAALRAEESRLLELMAQAEDMSDLLIIEERLTEVRYQLESCTSQLRRYDNQVDYATISLDISEVQQYTPVVEQTFLERITTGFMGNLAMLITGLEDALVYFIVSLPYLAVLALIVVAVVFFARKGSKKRQAKRAAEYQKRMAQYQQQQQNQQNQQNQQE